MQNKLVHTEGRIVIMVDKTQKDHHTFSDGTTIRLERKFNNLDNAYTKQTLATVISGKNIPEGALILFHFNAIHDTNKIFNYHQIGGEEIASNFAIYSLAESECFLWKKPVDKEWNPIGNFALGLRVFKPYPGLITGIEPEQIKDALYITTGKYKGLVCRTVKAAAYRLIFRGESGQEEEFLRCRPDGDEEREPEVIAVDEGLTEGVLNGKLLVGLTSSNAKSLNEKEIA